VLTDLFAEVDLVELLKWSLPVCVNVLEGASNFVPWKGRLHNLLEAANLWHPFTDDGHTAYRSQMFGSGQQECSECEGIPIGLSEGSFDPSYCWEDYQADV